MNVLPYDRAGSGLPIVFLHAFPLSRKMWEGQRDSIARHFQFIAFDAPGFGASDERPETLAMDAVARRVVRSLDDIGARGPAVFVGLSMGGYILMQILRLAPERVRAAVFVATRTGADAEAAREKRFQDIDLLKGGGLPAFAERTATALLGSGTRAADPALVERVREWVASTDPKSICAALRGLASRPDSTAVVDRLSVPGLFIAGAEDGIATPTEMEGAARRVMRSEFHKVDGPGHLVNLEKPAIFEDLLRHFLKRSVL